MILNLKPKHGESNHSLPLQYTQNILRRGVVDKEIYYIFFHAAGGILGGFAYCLF